MNPLRIRYTELCEFLDDRPDGAGDFTRLALLALAGYLLTLGVRLLEGPAWNNLAFMAAGERILSTHDAYCWLAGAKGVNAYAQFGMSRLAALLAGITGQPLWSVGFWAPAFLASLTSVAVCLWAWLLAGRCAAIAPAMLGALSPGFFYRSRLGYYDSDVFTQLMPLLLGFFLAALLARTCRRTWLVSASDASQPLPAWLPWLALCFGLFARVAHFAHDDIHPLGIGLFWLALGLVALTGLPGRRVAALRLLIIYGLAAYAGPRRFGVEVFSPGPGGLLGLALAVAAAALIWRHGQGRSFRQFSRWLDSPWPWLAILATLALGCGLLLPLGGFWAKVLSYFKPVADAAMNPLLTAGPGNGSPPLYPGITQSIREAKNVSDLLAFFSAVAPAAWMGVAGLGGLAALLLARPAFVLLLPMAILGLASLKLGARFAMFGGPIFALGLGIGLHWLGKPLVRRFGLRPRLLVWSQVLLVAGCLVFDALPRSSSMRPSPVLAPDHAEALLSLRASSPKDAEVWTWWDFGYATQYFAERRTPTDGGKHAGRDIYATALALSTPSFSQAARLIHLSASQNHDPARRWDAMGAQAVREELEGLKTRAVSLPSDKPQYLVVCWENLTLLYWISFYGSWDVVSGTGEHAAVQTLRDSINVDQDAALLVNKRSNSTLPLKSVDILDERGQRTVPLPKGAAGQHLIINEITRQALLLDDMAYNSMATQLLIGDPRRPEQARSFKLLYEGFPLVRIYEVLSPVQEPAAQAKVKEP